MAKLSDREQELLGDILSESCFPDLKWPNEHDEAMRMQALAVGATLARVPMLASDGTVDFQVMDWARWAYREATGRAW